MGPRGGLAMPSREVRIWKLSGIFIEVAASKNSSPSSPRLHIAALLLPYDAWSGVLVLVIYSFDVGIGWLHHVRVGRDNRFVDPLFAINFEAPVFSHHVVARRGEGAITPSVTATSAVRRGAPVPSTTVPF